MPRPGRCTRARRDEPLDDAILERVEGDDGETSPGLQRALGGKQRAGQFAELVVDEDAQRLEDARRGMDLVLRMAAHEARDRIGEVEGAGEGPDLAPLLDHARDASRMALFAEQPEDTGEIGCLEPVDDVGGAGAGAGHAHVERPVGAKGKAALGLVDLHR